MQNSIGYQQVVAEAPVEERLAFLKKVYGLLTLSILVAAGAAWMTATNAIFYNFVAERFIMFVILEFVAIFFTMWARKKEMLGLVALFTFTALTGIVAAPITMQYAGDTVINALLLTGIIFFGLTLYTITSKKDFSFMGGMLTVGLMVLIFGGLLNAFFFQSAWGSFMFSCVAVFLFSGFIIYDTFNIMRRYPTDEYISATLALYLDILNLFLALLRILGMSKD